MENNSFTITFLENLYQAIANLNVGYIPELIGVKEYQFEENYGDEMEHITDIVPSGGDLMGDIGINVNGLKIST